MGRNTINLKLIMSHIGTSIFNNEPRIRALYAALEHAPVSIRIPPGARDYIIDIEKVIPRGEAGVNISIDAGSGSSARIMVRPDSLPHSCSIDFTLAEGAEILYEAEHLVCAPALLLVTAQVHANAKYVVQERVTAHAFFYSRYKVALSGEGALFTDEMRYSGASAAVLDMERAVHHRAGQTLSHMNARGVARDEAKVLWRGKVRVEKQAKKSSAFQRHDAILAGAGAHIDAAPYLEIFTHDVSCKHSASVTRIPPENLFYLASRGVPFADAHRMLTEGFLSLSHHAS
ncbi:MAG: Fe-S cluster assembly protein SufD [Parcubacteria group bacterium Gr01-1014_29]|nr:MAG: Fe-S cluster assembly protein SufD [Parcubacteria group bacterium Gr01-1014_29]